MKQLGGDCTETLSLTNQWTSEYNDDDSCVPETQPTHSPVECHFSDSHISESQYSTQHSTPDSSQDTTRATNLYTYRLGLHQDEDFFSDPALSDDTEGGDALSPGY